MYYGIAANETIYALWLTAFEIWGERWASKFMKPIIPNSQIQCKEDFTGTHYVIYNKAVQNQTQNFESNKRQKTSHATELP